MYHTCQRGVPLLMTGALLGLLDFEPTALAAGLTDATLDAAMPVASAIGSAFETEPRLDSETESDDVFA
jgi:hypothetical protein